MNTDNLPNGVLNGLHPIGAAFIKLSYAIEKLPASDDQTAACIARTECAEVVGKHLNSLRHALRRAMVQLSEVRNDSDSEAKCWALAVECLEALRGGVE